MATGSIPSISLIRAIENLEGQIRQIQGILPSPDSTDLVSQTGYLEGAPEASDPFGCSIALPPGYESVRNRLRGILDRMEESFSLLSKVKNKLDQLDSTISTHGEENSRAIDLQGRVTQAISGRQEYEIEAVRLEAESFEKQSALDAPTRRLVQDMLTQIGQALSRTREPAVEKKEEKEVRATLEAPKSAKDLTSWGVMSLGIELAEAIGRQDQVAIEALSKKIDEAFNFNKYQKPQDISALWEMKNDIRNFKSKHKEAKEVKPEAGASRDEQDSTSASEVLRSLISEALPSSAPSIASREVQGDSAQRVLVSEIFIEMAKCADNNDQDAINSSLDILEDLNLDPRDLPKGKSKLTHALYERLYYIYKAAAEKSHSGLRHPHDAVYRNEFGRHAFRGDVEASARIPMQFVKQAIEEVANELRFEVWKIEEKQ